ncbi:hypothetical protein EDC94DRAFT_692913 [Helicostylum pulchrum]|nr:hypothetical protein EDC94DRAFT_692913 [Helicostylum pulchrum]
MDFVSDAIADQPSPPMRIPLRLLLRPFFWKKFWSLPMTAKAFTPWWRVLQDCIGAKQKLHSWSPTAFLSPFCTIHTMNCSEDFFHMIVQLSVWTALTCLSSTTGTPGSNKMKPLPNDIPVIVGTAFSTLCKYHWFCVIQEKSWSSIAVYQKFQQDHNNAINNFKSNHTTTEKWSSIKFSLI